MIRALTGSASSVAFLAIGLATLYLAVPLWVNFAVTPDPYFPSLAGVTAVAVAAIVAGFSIPWLDRQFTPGAPRMAVPGRPLQAVIWSSFILFMVVVIATAESVPLWSALKGATGEQLSVERGAFLKARAGWQGVLPYIGTIYMGALLPYATARLFTSRHPLLFAGVALFTLYTVLALEKAAFVFALAPMLYLSLNYRRYVTFAALLWLSATLLYFNTVLARGVDAPTADQIARIMQDAEAQTTAAEPAMPGRRAAAPTPAPVRKKPKPSVYFTAKYIPTSALDHIVWRSGAVPVFTAADAFRVFDDKFEGAYFLGSTSSLVAKATGREQVNYDAEVFAHQYGRSDIGRANSVYFTEAYVNFGWAGVILFSLFVGQALRWLAKSRDDALQAMWPLFCWFVFMAGLMGTLLSNGYALIFALALFGRVDPASRPVDWRQGWTRARKGA